MIMKNILMKLKRLFSLSAVSGSVCTYCKDKKKIFHWEFGQFVECSICQTDR